MKTIIVSISLILLIAVSLIIAATKSSNPNDTEVVVMKDITDIHISQPKAEDINTLFDLNKSLWNSAKFRFVEITDVSYNHVYETNLDAENKWLGNEFDRLKKIKDFYAKISQILNDTDKEPVGKDNSSVYIPIAHELNRLAQSRAQLKIILIYSDLMENAVELSFYNKQKFNLLKSNPQEIIKYLEAQVPLQKLNGIKIYLIYQPSNTNTDEMYKTVSGFYKNFFENKGAKVEITANIE